MADERISELTELTTGNIADTDLAVAVDVSDTTDAASGTTKKTLFSSVYAYLKAKLDSVYQPLSSTLTTWAGKTPPTGTVVGDSDAQTLASKTLTTPTIASFANANHDHSNSAGGGALAAGAYPTMVGDSGSGGTKGAAPAPASGDAAAGKFLKADGTWTAPPSGGDASTNTSSSVDSEVALFSGTAGKTLKRASGSGIAKLVSGVLSLVTAPSGAIVGDSDTQTLTNKSISGDQITSAVATATALATARSIYGNLFDGTAALAQIIASTFGGTGNGFTKFSGPASSEKTFTLPNASATILTDNAAVTTAQGGLGGNFSAATGLLKVTAGTVSAFSGPSGSVVGTTDTQTLTNKRVTKRTGTTTSSATPTINTDNVDFYSITALAAAITSFTTNLSGTPTEAQTLWIAVTDNGTARAISWGSSFEASTVALPTTTVISTRLDVGFVWNTVTSKWRCVAVA